MFTNVFISLAMLMVAAFNPPDYKKLNPINQSGGMCPNGRIIVVTDYDADPQDNDAVIRVFEVGQIPIASVDMKKRVVYLYGERKVVSVDEVKEIYPSPCDIPVPQGV